MRFGHNCHIITTVDRGPLELLPLGEAGTRGPRGLALETTVGTDSRVETLPGLSYHWLHVCDTVKEIGRVKEGFKKSHRRKQTIAVAFTEITEFTDIFVIPKAAKSNNLSP